MPTLESAETKAEKLCSVSSKYFIYVDWIHPTGKSADSLGSWWWDITRRLLELIQPSDYYPLLVFQAGSDEVDKKGIRVISKEFKTQGQLTDESRSANGVLLSSLSGRDEYWKEQEGPHQQ